MKHFWLVLGILFTLIVVAINNWLGYVMILLAVFLIFSSAIIIHEIGHLIAGLLLRYRFLFLIIGPFVFSKRNGTLRVNINRSDAQGGLCCMMPNFKNYHVDRKNHIIYLASGSIANFLTTLVAAALYYIYGGFWLIVIIFHVLAGIIAIVPYRAEGVYYSDGLAIKIVASQHKISKIYYDMLRISFPLMYNTNLEKEDNEAFEKVELEYLTPIKDLIKDENKIQRELVTYVLGSLVTWNIMNGRFQRCIQLLQPFIEEKYLSGILKEELIISYLYAKLAVEHKLEKSSMELDFKNSGFHVIPKLKFQALLLFDEKQKKLAVKTLISAKEEIRVMSLKLYSEQIEMNIIDKFIQIIENN